jgi:hypothetical protein
MSQRARLAIRTVSAFALGILFLCLIGTAYVQPKPLDNYPRPYLPPTETFLKDVADSIKELAVAVKAVTTIKVTWDMGPNAFLAIVVICFAALLTAAVFAKRGQCTS